jgi:hypothetical protein
MMKYKGTHVFDAPIEMVELAREKRFEKPEFFPELKARKEIERIEEGNILKSKRTMELAAKVPPALRMILSPDMLNCIDESVYDRSTGVHTWTVVPSFKTELFRCTGQSKYKEITVGGEVKTQRELELTVEVKIPMLGKLAEQVVLDAYKKNVDKDVVTIKKMISIMKEEGEA